MSQQCHAKSDLISARRMTIIQPYIYCINLYMLLVVLKVPVVYPSLDGNYNVLNTFQGLKDAIHTEIVW